MYYWDSDTGEAGAKGDRFQQLLEECTIGTSENRFGKSTEFVSVVVRRMYYWDDTASTSFADAGYVSVVVRRMYYWDCVAGTDYTETARFQQLLEECTIGTDVISMS